MLAALGFGTIIAFVLAILSRRVSVLVALILIPVAFGLMTGAGPALGPMMLDGLRRVAPVGIMITFALLYFGLMLDRGLFDPMIRAILRLTRGDPVRICIATVALTTLVALDGDGSTTFLITIAAVRPVYDRLGMSRLVMAACAGLAAGVMNVIPWGGPTTRVMALMGADASQVFNPLLLPIAAGLAWCVGVAAFLGLRERRRLGLPAGGSQPAEAPAARGTPPMFWPNLVLTAALLAALLAELAPLSVLFMLGFAVALTLNCPSWEAQQKQLASHAGSIILVTAITFAAGIFTGILNGTKMIDAVAAASLSNIPPALAGVLPLIVAVAGVPLSIVIPADAYYFGVLPVLTQAAPALGLEPLALARAALLSHMTTGFPLSPLVGATFVLVGRSGIDFGEFQRFLFLWALGSTLVMAATAYAVGAI